MLKRAELNWYWYRINLQRLHKVSQLHDIRRKAQSWKYDACIDKLNLDNRPTVPLAKKFLAPTSLKV